MQRPMQFQDALSDASGTPDAGQRFVVKAVDVLRDEPANDRCMLESGYCKMCWVRAGVSDGRIAEVGSQPGGR